MYSYCDAAVLDSSSISCKFFLVHTTMLCVRVYSVFLFTTICPQQELVGLIVDAVPPSARGSSNFLKVGTQADVVASRNFSKSLQ